MEDRAATSRFFAVASAILDVAPESLAPECSRDNLEAWDSLKHMYIILALEEEFGIEFGDEEIAELSSIGDLMSAITEKTGFALMQNREDILVLGDMLP